MANRAYLDVYQSRVAAALAAAGTSLVLDSVTGLAAQDVLIIDEGNTKSEVVFVTAVTTLTKTATVVRAMASTTAVAHAKRAIVKKVGWKIAVTVPLADISTNETALSVLPKGILVRAWGVLGGAIGTNDSIITLSKVITTSAQAITNGVITVATSSSAKGDIDECLPTLYNEFNGTTEYLQVVGGGQSSNSFVYNVICEMIVLED